MKLIRLICIILSVSVISCSDSKKITDGYIDTNGTRLYYKTLGSGDPILILHGGPGFDHRQFLPYIWELAKGHKVILYDQRGTGLSSGPVDSVSITVGNFIKDIEGIRQAFGIEKLNLLGHSWGGILAMYYGIAHPERLKSLILCSTTASFAAFGEMRANYNSARLPEDTKLIEEIYTSEAFKKGDPAAWTRFWQVYFKPYFPDQSQVMKMDLTFPENTIKYSGTVAGLILGPLGRFDIHDKLKAIQCPVLIIHGDSDPMPFKYAEQIHQSIPQSELVKAEHAGHWLFVDATDTFRDSILAFLKKYHD